MSEFKQYLPDTISYSQVESKEAWSGLLCHHARPLEYSPYGIVTQVKLHEFYDDLDRDLEESSQKAYEWIERHVGFYPLFMAVGEQAEDIRMTGYQNQWRTNLDKNGRVIKRTPKNEFANYTLFSFSELPKDGVFMDFDHWGIVLNSHYRNFQTTDYERRMIFHPSWNTSDWLRQAKKEPHSVQLVVPELDLRAADIVSVRNRSTQKEMEKR